MYRTNSSADQVVAAGRDTSERRSLAAWPEFTR